MSCFKCGWMGHWAHNCFAYLAMECQAPFQPRVFAVVSCTRRGRIGHQIQDCFARSTKDGQSLLDKKTQTYGGEISGINKNHQVSRKRKRPFAGKKRIGVDVLEYQHGNIYVSKSNNIDACIHQHAMRSVI